MYFSLNYIQICKVERHLYCYLIFSNDADWKRIRGPWNHTMMKTSKVYEGIDNLNDISTDFIDRIRQRRNAKHVVEDINRELFRWALEGKHSSIIVLNLQPS